MLETPFYVVSDTDNTLTWKSVNGVKLNWSLNEDLTDAHALPADTTTTVPMQAGKKLYLFCTEDQKAFTDNNGYTCNINCASIFSLGGNACFLSEASCYKKTEFQPACRNEYQFFQLVSPSRVIVDAANMVLGFSTLADRCYANMFAGCTSLTTAPQLPATTLAKQCYDSMFYSCTSLVAAPQLPATTLVDSCYSEMFFNCTKIEELHFAKEVESNSTFTDMYGAPKFGATNATVHYDL